MNSPGPPPAVLVVDSSVVLAVMLGEPGADAARYRLSASAISSLNYAEVLAKIAGVCGSLEEALRRVERLDLAVVPFDAGQATIAASLAPAAKPYGLSLADRACLALGISHGATVVTADRIWQKLSCGVAVECIR